MINDMYQYLNEFLQKLNNYPATKKKKKKQMISTLK